MNPDSPEQIERNDDEKIYIDNGIDKTELPKDRLQDKGEDETVQVYYLCHADLKVKTFAQYGTHEISNAPVFFDSNDNLCIKKVFTCGSDSEEENSEEENSEEEEKFEIKYIKKLISIQSIKVQKTLDDTNTLTHPEVYGLFLPILL